MCDNINAFNSIELPLYKCSPYTLWEWEQSTQFISHIEFNFTSNRFFFIALLLYMWKSVCCSMTSQHIFRQWTKNLRLISLKNFMKFGILVGLGWDDRLVNGFFVLFCWSTVGKLCGLCLDLLKLNPYIMDACELLLLYAWKPIFRCGLLGYPIGEQSN